MCYHNGWRSYIRCIWLDKREASPDDHETLQKNPSDIQSLEVELANLEDLAANNLANALDYLKRLLKLLRNLKQNFGIQNLLKLFTTIFLLMLMIQWL